MRLAVQMTEIGVTGERPQTDRRGLDMDVDCMSIKCTGASAWEDFRAKGEAGSLWKTGGP